jgi:glycerol-3-phosphate dehydrogenase (NAD(P)+)
VARVTILGAGDMGTALVTPLVHNRHDIRLWGTERDDAIVEVLRAGSKHPRLRIAVPKSVAVYPAGNAAEALRGAEIVVVAITSGAVRTVLSRLMTLLGIPGVVVTVAKGFDRGSDGQGVQLLPETIGEFTSAPVVAVGGPSKANEVAHGQPTAVVFGSSDRAAIDVTQSVFTTPIYRVIATDDLIGLEVAAAMKNAYAIALGVADGLERQTGMPHHNLRAALFPMAVSEMAVLARALGGNAETAFGLAGAGDLQVTITSGRNRLLGERIGLGIPPRDAVHDLTSGGTTVEGYAAAELGHRLYQVAEADGALPAGSLPLLNALWRILFADAAPGTTLWNAV